MSATDLYEKGKLWVSSVLRELERAFPEAGCLRRCKKRRSSRQLGKAILIFGAGREASGLFFVILIGLHSCGVRITTGYFQAKYLCSLEPRERVFCSWPEGLCVCLHMVVGIFLPIVVCNHERYKQQLLHSLSLSLCAHIV